VACFVVRLEELPRWLPIERDNGEAPPFVNLGHSDDRLTVRYSVESSSSLSWKMWDTVRNSGRAGATRASNLTSAVVCELNE
jgi:hypothetical protein